MTKYPRTKHLPWSPGATPDDERIIDVSAFVGKRVIVTEKMDGEGTTIHREGCHARSLDTAPHGSRARVRALAGALYHLLPKDTRLCGENVYAEHSIHYTDLPSHFLLFGWHRSDTVASWEATKIFAKTLGLVTVPVLYEGMWDEDKVRACMTGESQCGGEQEGYVVRLAESFSLDDFGTACAKYVRKDHVQTDDHWLSKPVVRNGLRR